MEPGIPEGGPPPLRGGRESATQGPTPEAADAPGRKRSPAFTSGACSTSWNRPVSVTSRTGSTSPASSRTSSAGRRTARNGRRGGKEQWAVVRLELVSLLKHKGPVAYVSGVLPNMEDADRAETRPLNPSEEKAWRRPRRRRPGHGNVRRPHPHGRLAAGGQAVSGLPSGEARRPPRRLLVGPATAAGQGSSAAIKRQEESQKDQPAPAPAAPLSRAAGAGYNSTWGLGRGARAAPVPDPAPALPKVDDMAGGTGKMVGIDLGTTFLRRRHARRPRPAGHAAQPRRRNAHPQRRPPAGRRRGRRRPVGPRRGPRTARPRRHPHQAAHGLSVLRPGRRRPRVPPRNAVRRHPPQARPGRRGPHRPRPQGGHHRPRLLRRHPPQGRPGRRPHRRPGSARHPRRADRRRPGLFLPVGRAPPPPSWPTRAGSAPSSSTTSAAAPST